MFASRYPVPVRILLSLVAALMITPLHAATPPDLYSEWVDAALPRERQISHALNRVLVKLSGRPGVTQQPEVAVIQDNAPLLIRTLETEADQVRVSFEPQTMRRLMDSLGLPLLPDDRPEVLVWLAQDSAHGVEFIEPGSSAYQLLNEGAAIRGLPLQAPLLDLQDQLALSADQLTSAQEEAIRQASARYQYDALLIGMRRDEQVEWTLWYDGQRVTDRSGTDRQSLQQVIGRVADRVFGLGGLDDASEPNTYVPQQVPVGPYQPEGQELVIEGIDAAGDYLAVTAALRQLSGVEAVTSAGQQDGRLRLIVRVSPETGLTAALSREPRLIALGAQHYRWVGQ